MATKPPVPSVIEESLDTRNIPVTQETKDIPETQKFRLFSACEAGDLKSVTLAVTSGADLTSTDATGNTVIHVLAARGHHHILSELLQHTETLAGNTQIYTADDRRTKHNLELQNEDGLTPLMLACYHGNLGTVKILLKAGANPNTTSESQFSWLHRLALAGEDGMMMLALNNYADGNVTDKHGRTPLHYACGSGKNRKIVDTMHGTLNANVDLDIQDKDGYSAVMYAVAQGDVKSTNILLDADCDTSLTAKNGQSAVCFIDAVDDIRTKEIITGKVSCKCEKPSENHKHKPRILPRDIKATSGDQALHVTLASPNYNHEVLQILTCHMSEGNIRNTFGQSPLCLASIFNRNELITLYSKATEQEGINMPDSIGFTPLMYAAGYGTVDMISHLIDNGSNISSKSCAKTQALYVACVLDKPENLKILLSYGADLYSVNECGWQALHESISYSLNCFRLIMEKSTPEQINSILPDGRTALHIVCDSNKHDLIEMLLEAGASVNIADIRGETPLYYSVSRDGGYESVRLLFEKGAEVDAEDISGRTPLWVAAYYGGHDSLPILLKHGAGINRKDSQGINPLMAACLGNHAKCVRFLLENGAEMEQCDMYNRTELEIACIWGHYSLVEILLENQKYKPQSLKEPMFKAAIGGYDRILAKLIKMGADKNVADEDGKTALYKALEYKQDKCARLLLDKGANIHHKTKTGRQALHMAAVKGMQDMVKLLIEKGADCNSLDEDNDSALFLSALNNHPALIDILLPHTNKVTLDTKDKEAGYSPLLIAAREGDTEICEKLLQAGADSSSITDENISALHETVYMNRLQTFTFFAKISNSTMNLMNIYGETPLYTACSENHFDMAKILIKNGAAVNTRKEDCGTSPIHIAADNGFLEIIKLLIKNKADVNSKMNDGRTALHIASSSGYVDIMEELIIAGAHINNESNEGMSPLFLAAAGGREKACQLLCKILNKQHINAHDNDGLTPLLIAAQGGHVECCRILLDSGADIHSTDEDGYTALHFACVTKSLASLANPLNCVSLLLDRGINIEQRGYDNKTALFIAIECQNQDAALLLISKGANYRSTDSSGNNILHVASKLNCLEVVSLLLCSERTTKHECKTSFFERQSESLTKQTNKEGFTPLHYACENGSGDIAALLLKYGATVPEGPQSPIILAAKNGYLDVVRQIMKHSTISSSSISLFFDKGEIYQKIADVFGNQRKINYAINVAKKNWIQLQKFNAICLRREMNPWVIFSGFQREFTTLIDLIDAKKANNFENILTFSLELMESIACDIEKILSHAINCSLSGSCKSGWKTGELDEFDFLFEIQVEDLKSLGDRDMKEWLYTYLLEILPDEAEQHEILTEEVKILGINRSRSAPCVNFTIGWTCLNGHNHEINFDITIAARLINAKMEDECHLLHLHFKPPFENYWQYVSDTSLVYVPIKEKANSTWNQSLVLADSVMKDKVAGSHPNIKDVMLILKFLRDLTFPRVLKYSPKRTSYKSNGRDGDLISSYIIQHLMYMELIKRPSNKEWSKSQLADRVLSILSTMESGQYTDLYRKSNKSILNTPFSDKENLLEWLRKDINIISSSLKQLSERYKSPTLQDVDNLSASIADNQDKVYIIAGDKLRKIGRDELYYKPDIRESLGLSPFSNVYYYLPPTLDDYEKRRPITAKIVLKRFAAFKHYEL